MRSGSERHSVVVVGWTEPRGSRPFFDTLVVATRDADGMLRYAGQVRSGLRDADLGRLWKRLRGMRTKRPPLQAPPLPRAHWVNPGFVIDVDATGRTRNGTLRRPAYAGPHEDRRETSHQRIPDKAADAAGDD